MNTKKLMGRPEIKVTRDTLLESYERNQRWDKVAGELGISLSTVMRRVKEYQIKKVYSKVQ